MSSIPTVPVLTKEFAKVFGGFDGILGLLAAELEKLFPGSGHKVGEIAQPKVDALRAATDVPAIAGEFLTEAGNALKSGHAVAVPHITDLAR